MKEVFIYLFGYSSILFMISTLAFTWIKINKEIKSIQKENN